MIRKLKIAVAAVLTIAVAAVFYYAFIDPAVNRPVSEAKPNEAGQALTGVPHPLTGIRSSEPAPLIPVAVVYDNFKEAGRQYGLNEASIVYELLAEGGITRLLAIFDGSKHVESVGPIRSLRPYMIGYVREYGGVLMHVGGSADALSAIASVKDLVDINQIGAHESYFERNETLPAPHNVFTTYQSWLRIIDRFSVGESSVEPWTYAYSSARPENPTHHQLEIDFFPDNRVGWVYDEEANRYLRFANGARHGDGSGAQIASDNVIIIIVPATVIDDIGRLSMKTTGTGAALMFRNGARIDGTWKKETTSSRMTFTDENGSAIELQPGTTWIEVVPTRDAVTVTELLN